MDTPSKLIADSGSTKTDWLLLKGNAQIQIRTQGINPFMLDRKDISEIILTELLPELSEISPATVHFYGAGCRGEQIRLLEDILRSFFPQAEIEVASDMLGAARALCGKNEGIACILGTGENTCLFDGKSITENIPPLGFILGDEGSGAVLGKRLIGDILKKQLPENICNDFFAEYGLSTDEIIKRVYKSPLPNRFLASFTFFLHKHKEDKDIQQLIIDEFCRFFKRNVATYRRPDLPVHFIGSIAVHFNNELKAAAERTGFIIGRTHKSPLEHPELL